jgi:BMFP domain-containing protein YqiC
MDIPTVHAAGSWIDSVSKAFTALEARVSALEMRGTTRENELRARISNLESHIAALEAKLDPGNGPASQ